MGFPDESVTTLPLESVTGALVTGGTVTGGAVVTAIVLPLPSVRGFGVD